MILLDRKKRMQTIFHALADVHVPVLNEEEITILETTIPLMFKALDSLESRARKGNVDYSDCPPEWFNKIRERG